MPSVARPLRADAARNRGLLLGAARAAFRRHGVAASLDDVARSAGVGPGTLYRHFPTRDALVLGVIDDGLTEIHRLGTELLEDPEPLDALQCWLDAYIEQGSMFEGLARTLASPPPVASKDSTCQLARRAGAALVERAVETGTVRSDIGINDVLDVAAAIAWVGEGQQRDAGQRQRLLRIVIDGLRASTG